MTMLDSAKRGAELVARSFTKPDDDWLPVCMAQSEDGEYHLRDFDISDDKILSAARMAAWCYMINATQVCFVTSAWATDMNGCDEVVVICHVSQDAVATAMASIQRDGINPPTLGPWQVMDEQDGTFVQALKMGIGVI